MRRLRKLVNYYIEEVGCDGLVPVEQPENRPPDHQEHTRATNCNQRNQRRVPIMAGTGSNSTREAIEMTKHAEGAGAAARIMCPYYNRPTQDGLLKHLKQ